MLLIDKSMYHNTNIIAAIEIYVDVLLKEKNIGIWMKKIAKEELCTIIYIKKNLITNKTETCNKVQIKKLKSIHLCV